VKKIVIAFYLSILLATNAAQVLAEQTSIDSRLNSMDAALKSQSEVIRQQQQLIEELKKQLTDQQLIQQKQAELLDKLLKATQPAPVDVPPKTATVTPTLHENEHVQQAKTDNPLLSPAPKADDGHDDHRHADMASHGQDKEKEEHKKSSTPSLTNPGIQMVVDTRAHISNLKTSQLERRQVNGFTNQGLDDRNGFKLQEADLSMFANVDPYFKLLVVTPIRESGIELEEAYFVTTSLPAGFQVKGGKFKSNTSRLNSQHPHDWDFADIALPYRAFLGKEAIGGDAGLQLTSRLPFHINTLLGGEVLQGSNELMFGRDDNKGPKAFTLFSKLNLPTGANSSLLVGPWAIFGSTRSDKVLADNYTVKGNSQLYGMEAYWKWRDGRKELTLQSEYMYFRQNGSVIDPNNGDAVINATLKRDQDGFYIQSLYRYDRWRIGARYDRLELFAKTFERDGVNQSYNGKPWRMTGSLEYNVSRYARFRAQFTHDNSSRDGRVNNEGILQAIFTIGTHNNHDTH